MRWYDAPDKVGIYYAEAEAMLRAAGVPFLSKNRLIIIGGEVFRAHRHPLCKAAWFDGRGIAEAIRKEARV